MDRNQYLALSHAPMMDDNSSEDHTTDRVDVLPDSRSDNMASPSQIPVFRLCTLTQSLQCLVYRDIIQSFLLRGEIPNPLPTVDLEFVELCFQAALERGFLLAGKGSLRPPIITCSAISTTAYAHIPDERIRARIHLQGRIRRRRCQLYRCSPLFEASQRPKLSFRYPAMLSMLTSALCGSYRHIQMLTTHISVSATDILGFIRILLDIGWESCICSFVTSAFVSAT